MWHGSCRYIAKSDYTDAIVERDSVIKMDTRICLTLDDSALFDVVGELYMDRKNINSSANKCFRFHLRPYLVIFRIASVSIPTVLLTWRLIDLGDELLKGEIHMSTFAGILTGVTALLLQTVIIMGLALITWWIFRRPYAPPEIVGSE